MGGCILWRMAEIICDEIAGKLIEKGVDGFFVDNCDVYYYYKEESIYQGLVTMLKKLIQYEKKVIINGGDEFVLRYVEENGEVEGILTRNKPGGSIFDL